LVETGRASDEDVQSISLVLRSVVGSGRARFSDGRREGKVVVLKDKNEEDA
jgi:hypothetical protein|tara:strand:+ start:3676 stop:3828 length:153 start_codon:yes stop_codon:yes gene_type:complete